MDINALANARKETLLSVKSSITILEESSTYCHFFHALPICRSPPCSVFTRWKLLLGIVGFWRCACGRRGAHGALLLTTPWKWRAGRRGLSSTRRSLCACLLSLYRTLTYSSSLHNSSSSSSRPPSREGGEQLMFI
jgi:hypothetical protein